MANNLPPVMHLLPCKNQCAYKEKRSAADVIYYYAKHNYIKNKITGEILFDLSKAFGRINRLKLWEILYGKGIPIIFIKYIIMGREEAEISATHNGVLSGKVENNALIRYFASMQYIVMRLLRFVGTRL